MITTEKTHQVYTLSANQRETKIVPINEAATFDRIVLNNDGTEYGQWELTSVPLTYTEALAFCENWEEIS